MWTSWNKIYLLKNCFGNFLKWGLNDFNWCIGMYYVLWCFSSICLNVFTFVQVWLSPYCKKWTFGSDNLQFLIFLTEYFSKVFIFCSVLTKLRDVNRAYLEKSSRYDSYYEAYQKTAETIMVSFSMNLTDPLKELWRNEKTFQKIVFFENK